MTLRLNRPPLILAYRWVMSSLDGRLGKILVPTYSGFYSVSPGPNAHTFNYQYLGYRKTPFSDAATFSDSSEFETPGVRALTSGAALKGAVTFNITMGVDVPPLSGHYLTIGEFLYEIRDFVQLSGLDYTITVRPPLRVNHPDGALVDLAKPKCRMRPLTDDTGLLNLDRLRFGNVTLDFIEDAADPAETILPYTGSIVGA